MKKILMLLMALVMSVSLCACASGEGEEPQENIEKAEADESTTDDGKTTEAVSDDAQFIGINIGYPDMEFFKMVEYGLKKSFDEQGWTYVVTYGGEEKMTENAATMIAQGIDALVDFGTNQSFGNAVASLCDDAQIPCITIDVEYDGAYFFGADNKQAGECLGVEMCEWIEENWDGKVDAVWVDYSISSGEIVNQRATCAIDMFQEKFGLSEDDVFWFDQANQGGEYCQQGLSDFLSSHSEYEKVAAITTTESYVTYMVGAAETLGKSQDVCYGAHSESSWTFNHFKETEAETDTYIGCVAYAPQNYGAGIVTMLETLFAGGEIEGNTTMEHYVITRDNYEQIWNESFGPALESIS